MYAFTNIRPVEYTIKTPGGDVITVRAGDQLRLRFKCKDILWVKAFWLVWLEGRFEEQLDFLRIDGYTWLEDGLIVNCTVTDPGGLAELEPDQAGVGAIAVIALSAAILGSGVIWYFTCDDIQKVMDTPVAKATSLGFVAVGCALLLWVWSRRK